MGAPWVFHPTRVTPTHGHLSSVQGSREALGPETVPVQASGFPNGGSHQEGIGSGILGNPWIIDPQNQPPSTTCLGENGLEKGGKWEKTSQPPTGPKICCVVSLNFGP